MSKVFNIEAAVEAFRAAASALDEALAKSEDGCITQGKFAEVAGLTLDQASSLVPFIGELELARKRGISIKGKRKSQDAEALLPQHLRDLLKGMTAEQKEALFKKVG